MNLPTDLLRNFLAIVDCGSMARAADRVLLSPPALSLQMKRLEDLLRQPLFRKDGRQLALTPVGNELVVAARKLLKLNDRIVATIGQEPLSGTVSIGIVQDLADTALTRVLEDFAALHPRTRLSIQVAPTETMLESLARKELDIVACLSGHTDPALIRSSPIQWIGRPELLTRDELPLALINDGCLFRTTILNALQLMHRPFRIAVETSSLAGLGAAIEAGIGVTARSAFFNERARTSTLNSAALPVLPDMGFALHRGAMLGHAAGTLADIVEQTLNETLC